MSRLFGFFVRPAGATIAVLTAAMLTVTGLVLATNLKIGDLDAGAPELRVDSRYNRDLGYMNAHYNAASDVFVVMVKTPEQRCATYAALMRIDALEWQLRQLPFVESTTSLALQNRRVLVGLTEAHPKWYELVENQGMLNTVTASAPRDLFNETCELSTLNIYLKIHKADTLARLVDHIERFAFANDTADVRFLMAAGSAGIEAVTNIAVKQAWRNMLLLVYAAVVVLVFVVFGSWRVVVVAVLPLMLTSIVAEALIATLGIGVKVATLPVIVLGVGIGVDYAFYVLAVMLARMGEGAPLTEAYEKTMQFTGKVVLLTGTTLAIGVATWAASDIKFQADMGVVLAFMILVNMLGALTLLPALSRLFLRPRKLNPTGAGLSGPR
jgi:predicted RND superfamily exporter protein